MAEDDVLFKTSDTMEFLSGSPAFQRAGSLDLPDVRSRTPSMNLAMSWIYDHPNDHGQVVAAIMNSRAADIDRHSSRRYCRDYAPSIAAR